MKSQSMLRSICAALLLIAGLETVGWSLAAAGSSPVTTAENASPAGQSANYGFDVLWDQTNDPGPDCSPSQNFSDLDGVAYAADDFYIPNESGWTIQAIYIDGVYSLGDGPAETWDVHIFEDSENSPGDAIDTEFGLTATSDDAGDIVLVLPEEIVLTQGRYWLSITAVLDLNPGTQQFFWCQRQTQNLEPFHWLDQHNLIGLGCLFWEPGISCLGAKDPDLLFSLGGRINTVELEVDTIEDTPDATPGDGVCADADGNCSLRAAVQETNALGGLDKIYLPAGVYGLELGQIDITDDLVLTGAGPEQTAIDGLNQTRLFVVETVNEDQKVFEIAHLTLGNANMTSGSGGAAISFGFFTHGVLNDLWVLDNTSWKFTGVYSTDLHSTMEVRDSLFQGNAGSGGPLVVGNATIINTKVISNTAEGGGGGIGVNHGTILNSEIAGNSSGSNGGGVVANGFVAIINTSITGNAADNAGGGIYYGGFSGMFILNSTIAGNTAGSHGGGIYYSTSANVDLEIVNATIVQNIADFDASGSGSGGGFASQGSPFENVFMRNSILFGNIDTGGEAPDCDGTIVSRDYNFIGDLTSCDLVDDPGNTVIGVDPLLLPLADNGGPTRTMALQQNSPASGAGSCTDLDDSPVIFDQRMFPRPVMDCDVGAFELDPWHIAVLPFIHR